MKKAKPKTPEKSSFQRSSRRPQIDLSGAGRTHGQRGRGRSASDRTKKADQTEQSIIDAAISFFWDSPFRELSIQKLMRGTSVSRAAFYQYFDDLYQLMEVLLDSVKQDILTAAGPWLADEGDHVDQLSEALRGLVEVGYRNGPLIRAIADAAVTDQRLEMAWNELLAGFDALVAGKIQQHQKIGLIGPLDAHAVAVALNRMDASLFIHHFGRRPRSAPDVVWHAMCCVWLSTLYGTPASELPK